MADWSAQHWDSSLPTGTARHERRSGRYRSYLPDLLEEHPLTIDRDLSRLLARAESSVRALSAGPGADGLAGIARFLLRSEAIASSRIEGVAPSARRVALAELGQSESVLGISDQAQLVSNNITVVRRATEDLARAPEVALAHIVDLHDSLLPDDPNKGLRTVQNWIGGSDWHPIDAAFVPPPPTLVAPLMADFVDYLNGATHSPLVQAALVHAQFETIHPFTDGNGRVGRALIHTVLSRRGLSPTAVLPVSLVLATLREQYVDGLTAYRYLGPPDAAPAVEGVRAWVRLFAETTQLAAGQADTLRADVDELRRDWRGRLTAWRERQGLRATPRSDSASARLLTLLPEAPVVTARTLQRILGVSHVAASAGLEELKGADILSSIKIERNTTAYLAGEILDLVTTTERRLASTRFDPALSPPNRPVPAAPRQT